MRLAHMLCTLAALLLPARRKPWGEAMRDELAFIESDREAVSYGFGCMAAAARERALDFDTRFAAGLWAVALIGAGFALFHIACAAHGLAVLRGAPDGFLDALLRSGAADAELVARYRTARPVVIALLFGLGFAHLLVAWFLARRQLRGFLIAWFAALLAAVIAVAIQLSIVWSVDGLPSEFVAVLVQAVSVPLLLLWSNGRHLQGKTV